METMIINTCKDVYSDAYTRTLRPVGDFIPNDYSSYVQEGWDMKQYKETGKGWLAQKLKGFGQGYNAYMNLTEYWDLKRWCDRSIENYSVFDKYLYVKTVMMLARKFQQACDYYGFDAMTTEIWNDVRYWQKNFDKIHTAATKEQQRQRAFCHSIAREQGERYNETWERQRTLYKSTN